MNTPESRRSVSRPAAVAFVVALAAIVAIGATAILTRDLGTLIDPVTPPVEIAADPPRSAPEPSASPPEQIRAWSAQTPPVPAAIKAESDALAAQLAGMPVSADWGSSFQKLGGSQSQSPSSGPRRTSQPSSSVPAATTFKDYLRTRVVSTGDDAVSTFSLDTDRTSFQLALNWVNSGYAVEPDSVRAEEWLNAFDYRYDHPLRDDSFALSSAVIEHPLNYGQHLVRLAFQAPPFVDDRPLNVTLVMDASGSMSEGNRIAIAKAAAEAIRASLRPRDRIAVVQFTSDVIPEFTVEHSAPDDRAVRYSIEALQPHQTTNVQAGLDLGVQLADQARQQRPGAHNYVILFSDGVANVDATDPFGILESLGTRNSANPLRLITIGVGVENFNDYLLEQLAQHGDGWYRYLSDADQARSTFERRNWLAISIPFADQTRAQVTWDEDVVASWRLIGYENRITSDESFAQDRREFAEIPAGSATTAFYEVELKRPLTSLGQRLGEIELRWVTPVSGASNRQHAPILGNRFRPGAEAGALLRFGAIVALASDRYSSLWSASSGYPHQGQVAAELATLQVELDHLDPQLGGLAAYRDFGTVLGHLLGHQQFTEPSRSGYSP